MPDNVTLGSVTYTTDEISAGVHAPRNKMVWGVDGTITDVSAANPLPVVQTGTPALPTGAATQATLANIDADIGATTDAAASTDTGTASLIALTKRVLTKLPGQGQATMAASQPVTIASNQSSIPVAGTAANGAAVSGNPNLIAGSDGTNARTISTDTSGRANVVVNSMPNGGTTGATVPATTALTGGTDGTNLRSFSTDTAGRQVVVGGAASGSAVSGNPVLIAGSDGTNARNLLTDASGRASVSATVGGNIGVQTAANSLPVTIANNDGILADQYITGQGSQLTLGNNVLLATAGTGSTDTLNFKSISISITPAAGTVTAGNITFEGSNDNTNFQAITLYDITSPLNAPISTYALAATTTRYFAGPVIFRYIRARISTGVTGTTTGVQAFTTLRNATFTPPTYQIANQTAANTNVTASIASAQTLATVTTVTTVSTVSNVAAIAAGTNAIGDVGTQYRANATGAATMARVAAAATTNATSVKASAGRVVGYHLTNNTAAVKFIKFYNKASAPTVGTDTPVATLVLPASGQLFAELTGGLAFATGIAYAITGAIADADTTAVAANDVHGYIAYA